MRQCLTILVALLLPGGAFVAGPRVARTAEPARKVDTAQSAALFVGVREFPRDSTLAPVEYGADDAVDLAYAMGIDGTPRLVNPERMVLALSGRPQKATTQKRLEALKSAGAKVHPAGQTDILALLEEQGNAVGKDGLLIVAFATHGISVEGTQYLLTADSILKHRETAVSDAKVRDMVARAGVPRSLILLDACRQRLTRNTRSGDADPRSAAALLDRMGSINGQVVFSAASAGGYAYDDAVRRNGVFTAAIVDGLHCQAPTDEQGFVTVDTLAGYVEERVLSWIRRHRDHDARRATQIQSEGESKNMPLSSCAGKPSGR